MKRVLALILALHLSAADPKKKFYWPWPDEDPSDSFWEDEEDYFKPTVPEEETFFGECETNDQCPGEFMVCSLEFTCVHKGVFPIYPIEFVGLAILPILIGFANVGGVGGGGLTVPMLLTFWGFTTKQAIAISSFMQFTGSVVRFFYSINGKHPEKEATHIDYGIVIVMLPLVILGSFVGVIINIVLPPVVLSIILFLLLVALTLQAGCNAAIIWGKETKLLKRKRCNYQANQGVQNSDEGTITYLPDIRYFYQLKKLRQVEGESISSMQGSEFDEPEIEPGKKPSPPRPNLNKINEAFPPSTTAPQHMTP